MQNAIRRDLPRGRTCLEFNQNKGGNLLAMKLFDISEIALEIEQLQPMYPPGRICNGLWIGFMDHRLITRLSYFTRFRIPGLLVWLNILLLWKLLFAV